MVKIRYQTKREKELKLLHIESNVFSDNELYFILRIRPSKTKKNPYHGKHVKIRLILLETTIYLKKADVYIKRP